MNIIKQIQTHRYREQTSGHQWGKEGRRGKIDVCDQEVQITMYKINRLQGYILQHKEHSQYFIITLNRVYKNIESLCYTPETNIVNHYTSIKNKNEGKIF